MRLDAAPPESAESQDVIWVGAIELLWWAGGLWSYKRALLQYHRTIMQTITCTHGDVTGSGLATPGGLDRGTLFHVSIVRHERGSCLSTQSEGWRSQFAFFDRSNDHRINVDQDLEVYRLLELVFENVRELYMPSAPSRRFAFFAFPCRPCAENFKLSKGRGTGILYAVELLRADAAFVGDMLLRNSSANLIRLSASERMARGFPEDAATAVEALARDYWAGREASARGGDTPVPEVLISGEVRLAPL